MIIKPWPYKLRKFKPGDIIASGEFDDTEVGIFLNLGHHPDGGSYNEDSYFFVSCSCWIDPLEDLIVDSIMYNRGNSRLAKQSERRFLFMKIKESGYKLNYLRNV
jgi:hypothetical protein